MVALCFAIGVLRAHAADPVVSNVAVRQLPHSRQVEITYDVEDADGDMLWVRVEVSDDGGATFGVSATTFIGDVGAGIAPGVAKRIVWDAGLDLGEVIGDRYQVKVIASDEAPREIVVTLPGGATMAMMWIPAGTFTMGSPSSEPGRGSDEGPQHEVTITKGFYLGKVELTQGQWEAVMGTTPWSGRDYVQENPNNPAVYISWNDVQAFIVKLNETEGSEVYRFPTEAEWEYSCRAGTTTLWSFGDDESQLGEYAWYSDNSGGVAAHEVGTKLPNPWGLYDMHGNVWEWVQDWWYGSYSSGAQTDPTGPATGSSRVVRGGYVGSNARDVRSADRSSNSPGARYYIGARLVRQGQ